ncbi:MAG: polysaccharide biosynthesis protein PslG [Solirubrobacteraceae bacterium]|nr:polysaccharide biosynthesis protein PslG [Solirubrobacteraceae bacterium]
MDASQRRFGGPRARVLARRVVTACAISVVAGLAAQPAGAAVRADAVGIYSEELERSNGADPLAAAAVVRDARAGLVRQPFSWKRIETSPGRLDFSVYDDVMAAAAAAGLSVLPVLMDPPDWRSTAPASGRLRAMYPPRAVADMVVLAAALVERYGPGGRFWTAHPELTPAPIHSWQVWNEPNITAFWATGPSPAAYTRLLEGVGSAIRAADPGAEIVAAGLPLADNGIPIAQFLDGMYAAGARDAFDTLAIHPYASDAAGVLRILWAVRMQLDGLGDRDRRIWATEFGWSTGGPPVTITMSETSQAAVLRDTIDLMRRSRDALRLRGFVVFRYRDVLPNPGQTDVWALHAGLLRADGSAKPALGALRAAAGSWSDEPAAAQQISTPADLDAAAAAATATAPGAGKPAPSIFGVRRRALRIRRFLQRGRLVVLVDVAPGGGGRRVRISLAALRDGRVAVRVTRTVGSRGRVARAVFRLGPRARRAQVLRVSATQGDVRATRTLRVHRSVHRL